MMFFMVCIHFHFFFSTIVHTPALSHSLTLSLSPSLYSLLGLWTNWLYTVNRVSMDFAQRLLVSESKDPCLLCFALLCFSKDIFTCEYVLNFTCNTNSYGLVDQATAKVSYTKKDHWLYYTLDLYIKVSKSLICWDYKSWRRKVQGLSLMERIFISSGRYRTLGIWILYVSLSLSLSLTHA